jgi:hypothetical protein
MKNLMILESLIVGFLLGIAVSAYIIYMDTVGRNIGDVLNMLSLNPVLESSKYQDSIFISFIFYIVVYMVYTLLLNLIMRINKKVRIILLLVIICLLTLIGFQQNKAFKNNPSADLLGSDVILENNNTKEIKKYFGEYEAFGNLNSDNKEDVAFVVKIGDEEDVSISYYLSASIKDSQGYIAKNLVYIDEDIKVESIKIEDNKIHLAFVLDEEPQTFIAEIIDDQLKEVVQEEIIEEEETVPAPADEV